TLAVLALLWSQHPDTHIYMNNGYLWVSAVGLASRYVTSTTDDRNSYLFGAIGVTLEQLREKPPHFCKGFSSLVAVWSGRGVSNSRPSAWEARS
ncbi:MAG: hypothetical protein QGG20_07925, partial [Dehalococcoidia bacterium]|nr:hypothetical protein [Dehalococcoidia bacterium]